MTLIMKKYVIGNWKLNPATQANALALAQSLQANLQQINQHGQNNNVQIGCTPSFVHLPQVAHTLQDSPIWVGVQDVSAFGTTGAFTGDVSAVQVADLGAKFTLVGHSERRQYHGENDDILTTKIRHAFEAGLSVIYCIGETKDEYERGDTQKVLAQQLALLEQFAKDIIENAPFPKLIIAYEPVWAIGTGLTPTLNEIEHTHNFISELLSTYEISAPLLYGGSVNDKNAHDIANCQGVDGVLVGGASLKADSFATIIQAFS